MKKLKITKIEKIKGIHKVRDVEIGETGHYLLSNLLITKNSGGGGLKYAASTIVFLSKKKLRDEDKEIQGSILTATLEKSRFTRYGKEVDMLLTHEAGLDKWYGLFDLGKDSGLLVMGTGEKGNKIKANYYQFPDGQVASKKDIGESPAMYFATPVNYAAFEELCNRFFRFGKNEAPPDDEIFSDEDDEGTTGLHVEAQS